MLYVAGEGREYWVLMNAAGPIHDKPPLVCTERPDGFIHVAEFDMIYSSLDELAIEHGCVIVSFESVEPIEPDQIN